MLGYLVTQVFHIINQNPLGQMHTRASDHCLSTQHIEVMTQLWRTLGSRLVLGLDLYL